MRVVFLWQKKKEKTKEGEEEEDEITRLGREAIIDRPPVWSLSLVPLALHVSLTGRNLQ